MEHSYFLINDVVTDKIFSTYERKRKSFDEASERLKVFIKTELPDLKDFNFLEMYRGEDFTGYAVNLEADLELEKPYDDSEYWKGMEPIRKLKDSSTLFRYTPLNEYSNGINGFAMKFLRGTKVGKIINKELHCLRVLSTTIDGIGMKVLNLSRGGMIGASGNGMAMFNTVIQRIDKQLIVQSPYIEGKEEPKTPEHTTKIKHSEYIAMYEKAKEE